MTGGAQPGPRGGRLTREEEIDLAARTAAGDRSAAGRLVDAHLKFVVYLAGRYRRFGVPVADLVQEGAVGLMEAIRRFNPERGTRLSTYAVWWIRAAIQDHIARAAPLARIESRAALKARLFGARRGGAPDVEDRAPVPVEALASPEPSPEDKAVAASEWRHRMSRLPAALAALSQRERHIIARRFASQPAFSRAAIGRELGLSKERVRQLELRALARMRAVLSPVG